MTLDITKAELATPYDTFKNSTVLTQTFSVAGSTFTGIQLLTYTIPLSRSETFSQVKINLSFDSSKWHLAPLTRSGKYRPSGGTDMQVFANYVSGGLNIILSITGGVGASYSAFTFSVSAKMFITPVAL